MSQTTSTPGVMVRTLVPLGAALALTFFAPLVPAADDPRSVALHEYQTEPPFLVRVDVDRPDRVYRAGDRIQVSVRSEREGFLYLFYCDAGQNVSCLFPNQAQQDNRIPAAQTVVIPQPSSGFQLRVGAPFGTEVLKAVVTTQPLQTLELTALTKGNFTPLEPRKFKGVFVELRGEDGTNQESPTPVPGSPVTAEAPRGWSEHSVELTTVAVDGSPVSRPTLAEVPELVATPGVVTAPEIVSSTESPSSGKRIGIFIGISKYVDPGIRPLETAHQDARAFFEVMRDVGQLTDSVLLVNEQATLTNIRKIIQEGLPLVTQPGDLILLYWSGHGGRTSNLDGSEPDGFDEYLVPHDGRLEPAQAIRTTMLLDKTFGRWIQNLDGRKLVVILDACHSGGQSAGAIKAITGQRPAEPFRDFFFQSAWQRAKDIGQRETAVLASSRASQLSFERRGRDKSVMTHFLVDKLAAATGPVTLKDAAAYLLERVPPFVEQQFPGTTQTPIFVDQTTSPIFLRP